MVITFKEIAMHRLIPVIVLAALAACSSPNVRSTSSYHATKAPPVRSIDYNPYAPYVEANATWMPPTFNRDGAIVKPAEAQSLHASRRKAVTLSFAKVAAERLTAMMEAVAQAAIPNLVRADGIDES